MKKSNNEIFKVINIWAFKFKWQIMAVFVFGSCTVQNQINKDEYKPIPKAFSAHFFDKLDTLPHMYDNRIFTRSLMTEFTDRTTIDYSKPIQIDINDMEVFLTFQDTNKKQYVLKFFGKRHKKKFVFYTNYKTISFPVFFVRKEMIRYSINIPNENEIIFENHNVNEGIFLVFGGGSSSTQDYKFKLLKNE